jgi:lambda family phage minor tail protein L
MSSSDQNFNKSLFSINPDVIIDLFEVDFSSLQSNFDELKDVYGVNLGAESVYRFCPMINGSNPVIWQGNSYQPLPISMSGFEQKSDGTLPRPKLKIANPQGLFSKIFYSNEDFIGCKVSRKRTYARFLDDENFQQDSGNPFGSPDPNSRFNDDVFFINRKTSEDKNFIEMELVSVLELEESWVPARIILADYCNWTYRCEIGCGYKGLAIETADGKTLTEGFGFKDSSGKIDPSKYSSSEQVPEWNKLGLNEGGIQQNGYRLGDVVKISPISNKDAYKRSVSLFVCIQDHNDPERHHPFLDKEYWLKDECSKTLEACQKRFSRENADLINFNKIDSTHEGLRFGGFPGTERYSIE